LGEPARLIEAPQLLLDRWCLWIGGRQAFDTDVFVQDDVHDRMERHGRSWGDVRRQTRPVDFGALR